MTYRVSCPKQALGIL